MKKNFKISFFLLLSLIFLSGVNSSLFFDLEVDRARCLLEELNEGGFLMVKWKISVDKEHQDKLNNYLNHITISIKDEESVKKQTELKSDKGKISYTHTEQGYKGFKICVTYHGGWHMPFPIYVGIKFASDNMDEPDISSAIKTEHVEDLHYKAKHVVTAGKELIDNHKADSQEEDVIASDLMRNSRSYYNIAVFQILVVLALGIYQVFNFRKFLLSNEVI